MKTRLARKINKTAAIYGNWDSNYQPYSVQQQQKALKTMRIPMNIRRTIFESGVFRKVPVEYRKYNPVDIVLAMDHNKMNPNNMKEYKDCMRILLNKN